MRAAGAFGLLSFLLAGCSTAARSSGTGDASSGTASSPGAPSASPSVAAPPGPTLVRPSAGGRALDVPRGGSVGADALIQGTTAISRDRRFVALPVRSFADDCEQVHVMFAPLGSVEGDRVLVRASGACSAEVTAKVATDDANARLTKDGFASLGSAGGFPYMRVGDVDVEWKADANGFDAEARVGKQVLGKTHLAREKGSSTTGGVLTLGERSVVYVYVAFETSKPGVAVPHGAGPGLATRTQVWGAIDLSAQPPVAFERVGGGELDEDPASASRATSKTCAKGAVAKYGGHVLHRCDGWFRVLDPRGNTIIEGTADPAASLHLDLYSVDLGGTGEFTPMPCVEIDGDAGDAIRCVDANGASVADMSGKRLTFDFFGGAPPDGAASVTSYLRVSSYVGEAEKTERVAFDGKRFPVATTLPGVTGP